MDASLKKSGIKETVLSWLSLVCVLSLLALSFPFEACCVPAPGIVHTLTQPDGSTLEAVQWGDEFQHGWETVDGYTIVFDEELKAWVYAAATPAGTLTVSSMMAKEGVIPSGISKKLRPPLEARVREFKGNTSDENEGAVLPATGKLNIPVILVNFKDTTTTYGKADFDELLFSTGTNSLKDYYEEVSYRKLHLSPGPEGVSGWYDADFTRSYYGDNVNTPGDDAWSGDLVYEAVAKADADGFNFAPYDRDGDCNVDVVVIVHQGPGEENSGVAGDIWSKQWSLSDALAYGRSHYGPYVTNSCCTANPSVRIRVNDFVIVPETQRSQRVSIGIPAHELGHALGLPDLYDTDSSSRGVGNWSLMSTGCFNGTQPFQGDLPAHPDAWCKYKLGWVNPRQVIGTLSREPILEASAAGDVYQLLSGTPMSGEYFLVENRQRIGFDAGLPGAGLLVWHIDGGLIASRMAAYQGVNTDECFPPDDCSSTGRGHYGVGLVQADNLWNLERNQNDGDAGDPYPGSTNETWFTHYTFPASDLWNGNQSRINVSAISGPARSMTATLSVSSPIPAGIVTEYQLPDGPNYPYDITAGPDGNLWYARGDANSDIMNRSGSIGKITTSGEITEYPLPQGSGPFNITVGPDRKLWFTDSFGSYTQVDTVKIGKITTGGAVAEYTFDWGSVRDITAGPDGRLWFTETSADESGTASDKIGRVTTSGVLTEFKLPPSDTYPYESRPYGITAGPDGSLWFTESEADRIGRISTSGAVSEYGSPTGMEGPPGISPRVPMETSGLPRRIPGTAETSG